MATSSMGVFPPLCPHNLLHQLQPQGSCQGMPLFHTVNMVCMPLLAMSWHLNFVIHRNHLPLHQWHRFHLCSRWSSRGASLVQSASLAELCNILEHTWPVLPMQDLVFRLSYAEVPCHWHFMSKMRDCFSLHLSGKTSCLHSSTSQLLDPRGRHVRYKSLSLQWKPPRLLWPCMDPLLGSDAGSHQPAATRSSVQV